MKIFQQLKDKAVTLYEDITIDRETFVMEIGALFIIVTQITACIYVIYEMIK